MKELIEKLVFEALGEASMCWSETPKGVFDSNKATEIGNRLSQAIQALSQSEWIKVEDRLPFCYERGNWDGLRSHQVLCKDKDGTCYIGLVYEGILDGSKFADWYDSKGWELKNIVEWKEI